MNLRALVGKRFGVGFALTAILLIAACGSNGESASETIPATSEATTTTSIPKKVLKAAGDFYIEIVTPMNCVTRSLSNAMDDFAADAGDFESVDQAFAALRQSVFPEAEKLSVVMLQFVRDMKTYDWPGPVEASIEGMINEILEDAETWASFSRLSTISEAEQWELTPGSESSYSPAIRRMLDLPAIDEANRDALECPEDVVATSLVDPPYIVASQQSPIDVGQDHYCVVDSDSSITCWGNNDDGQATPPVGTFRSVSAGYRHTCGVSTDFTVSCWGANGSNQSAPPSDTFAAVSSGWTHTCGILMDSTLSCWGQSPPPNQKFISISAGSFFTCGIRTDSTMSCWGSNDKGQGTPPTGTFIAVSAGSWHACGIRTDSTVVCWGDNQYGQATPPKKPFTSVAAGAWYSCGISTDSTVICWGSVKNGEGVTPTTTTTTPPTSTSVAPPKSASSAPATSPPPPQTTQPSSSCHPSYTPCVPIASDVDCAGGDGNGPVYVSGPITVIGRDVYELDWNNDGVACEKR